LLLLMQLKVIRGAIMRGRFSTLLVVSALLLAVSGASAQEENRWITDQFEVTLRTGKSTQQSIIRMLSSGTRVELLELDADSGYARVRTRGGAEGWVLSRYLLSQPPALVAMPEVQRRFEQSESRRRDLEQANSDLMKRGAELEQRIAELERAGGGLQNELDKIREMSANVIQVDEQNRELSQRLAETEQLLQEMRTENERLGSRASREWFIVGAAVLAIGMALGLILPRIRWKRKSSWSDF
jgi:SH3 domain protein